MIHINQSFGKKRRRTDEKKRIFWIIAGCNIDVVHRRIMAIMDFNPIS